MLNCQKIIELISSGYDKTSDPVISKQINQHLKGCNHCRQELKALEDTWNLLGSAPSIKVPEDFEARFWTKITNEKSKESFKWQFPRIGITLAYALGIWCLVILSSFLLTNKNNLSVKKYDAVTRFTSFESDHSLKTAYMRRLPQKIRKIHTIQGGTKI